MVTSSTVSVDSDPFEKSSDNDGTVASACVVVEQGKLDEAEHLYRRAIDITEATQGVNHPNFFKSLRSVSLLLHQQVRATFLAS